MTGKWRGKATYGEGYPLEYRGIVMFFSMYLDFSQGTICGSCIDDITEKLMLKPASIQGTFENKLIKFIKRYPCKVDVDGAGKSVAIRTEPSYDIKYNGRLRIGLFSRKQYFSGIWSIAVPFVDANMNTSYHVGRGRWRMDQQL